MPTAFQTQTGRWVSKVKIWSEESQKWVWKNLYTQATTKKQALELGVEFERASRIAKNRPEDTISAQKLSDMLENILAISGVRVSKDKVWPKITDWLEQYLDGRETRGASFMTLRTYKTYSGHFLGWLEDNGALDARLDWLTPKRAEEYYLRALEKMTTKSANERLKFMRRVYGEALKVLDYPKSPFRLVTLVKNSRNEEKLDRLPFTPEEVGKLVGYLKQHAPEWYRAAILSLMTSCRLEDAVTMSSENVEAGVLTYTQKKSGKEVQVPLQHEGWLSDLQAIDGLFCPRLAESFARYKSTVDLSGEFVELVSEAGIDQEFQQFKSGRSIARKSFHSIRHTLRSAIIAAGGTDAQADLVTGHSPGQGKAYTHADMETLKGLLSKALKQ